MTSTDSFCLAVDCSTSVMRIGLSLPDGRVLSAENRDRFRHAEFVIDLTERLLKEAGIGPGDIRVTIASTGPGSFTGLRVGMAACKGLAVATGIPIVGLSNFAAYGPSLYSQFGNCAIIIPSRKNEYYLGKIESERYDENDTAVLKIDKLKEKVKGYRLFGLDCDMEKLFTDGFSVIRESQFKPGIDFFIAEGLKRLETSGGDDLSTLEPLYVQRLMAGKTE